MIDLFCCWVVIVHVLCPAPLDHGRVTDQPRYGVSRYAALSYTAHVIGHVKKQEF